MEDRRVVVTGLGTVNPLGSTVDATWKNLLSGTSGISNIERVDVSDLPSKIGGEIKDFEITDYMPKRLARRMDRFAQFFWVASRDALIDAGIEYDEDDPDAYRTGVLVGTGIGGVETFADEVEILHNVGPHRLTPYGIPKIIGNMAGGQVSIDFNLYGPNNTTVTACAASANAIGDAGELIKRGAADVMVAGGSDASITRFAMAGFAQARALTTNNDDPQDPEYTFGTYFVGEGSSYEWTTLFNGRRQGAAISVRGRPQWSRGHSPDRSSSRKAFSSKAVSMVPG